MAVKSVHERHQQRRSSFRDGKITHIREWLVECDDKNDGTAVAVTGVPSPDSEHPKDSKAKLSALEAQPHEQSDLFFLVQGEYTGDGFGAPIQSPLDRRPDVSYSYTDATEPYFIDNSDDKKVVVNTAGDAFESFNERETGELVITIVVNEATYNPIEFDDFKHTTNTNVVTIDGIEYAADICKLSPVVGAKTTETVEQNNAIENFTYYKNTYVVKARKKGWKDEIADIGLNELVPDVDETKPPKLMPIVDATGLLIKKPWPLDGHGRKKPKPTDTPETLKFQPYTSIDWSDLKPFKPETWEQE